MQTKKLHLDVPKKRLLSDQKLRLTVEGELELLPGCVSEGTGQKEAGIVAACLVRDCASWGF